MVLANLSWSPEMISLTAEKLFLQEKPTHTLLFIGLTGKTYTSVISKEIDSPFAYTSRVLQKLEHFGLIRFTVEGRRKFVELTEYGKEVGTSLKEFKETILNISLAGGR